MAGMKYGVEFNPKMFDSVQQLGGILPEVRARALGWVGSRAASLLYSSFLQGQAIRLTKKKDSKGRRTYGYSIGRRAGWVKISAYPMNLFERGRMLRSGRRESGKNVIEGRFKTMMDTRLQGIINQFDSKHLKEITRQVEKDIAAGRSISRQGYMK
jgi:hypothetical protein